MTITLIVCGISFAAIALMLAGKNRELSTGRSVLNIGSESLDEQLAYSWKRFSYGVTHTSVRSIQKLTHRTIIKLERFFISRFEHLGHKFAIVGDVVTGKDIPRNRGSVSFFLKNIETHKRKVGAGKM